jgi:hypothetical protein
VHDGTPNVRSMAVKFQLLGGRSTDILANSIDEFVARTPEQLAQDGAGYSDNPTFRREFERIVEGARKAGSPEG